MNKLLVCLLVGILACVAPLEGALAAGHHHHRGRGVSIHHHGYHHHRGTPPGWSHGRKVGWGGLGIPPGKARGDRD